MMSTECFFVETGDDIGDAIVNTALDNVDMLADVEVLFKINLIFKYFN